MEVRFTRAMLARFGLPDILYPITVDMLDAALGGGGNLSWAELLHGLQQRSAAGDADWQALEPALDRLAELVAPADARAIISAGGEDWWVEIGPVDLGQPIVTIQRREQLVAALGRREDGRLRLAVYRPLDAKSARCVIALSLRPHPDDGSVCMRENNWEYALDSSASWSQWYAFERGEAHLSSWEYGIGIHHDGATDPEWQAMSGLAARRPAKVAIELGVAYAFSDEAGTEGG